MSKKKIIIIMNVGDERHSDIPARWLDRYHCFVLIGEDFELLHTAASFLENEGKEVYILKDVEDIWDILPFIDQESYENKHIAVSVC